MIHQEKNEGSPIEEDSSVTLTSAEYEQCLL